MNISEKTNKEQLVEGIKEVTENKRVQKVIMIKRTAKGALKLVKSEFKKEDK